MKKLLTTMLLFAAMTISGFAQINTLTPGSPAPDIKLKNIDDKEVGFGDFANAKGYIVVFSCNTCPVVKAYEKRIIELNEKYAAAGYPVIAINANDPSISKGDSFERMQARAKEMNYQFPYLYDEGQQATNAYGARNTPHIFLVNKTPNGNVIAYTGAIDNDPDGGKSERVNYLAQAIASVQAGSEPSPASTKAVGCGIKRKKS